VFIIMQLWQKVTLGLIFGIVFGMYFPNYVYILKPFGQIFMRLISMVIFPLIFLSLVSGITSLSDSSSLGRIGLKSVCSFFTTTLFAVIFGLGVGILLEPGAGMNKDFTNVMSGQAHQGEFDIVQFFVRIVPDNVIGAFAGGYLLQVVFFSIFTGICMNKLGEKAQPIKELFQSFFSLVLNMISIIIQFSPYGAFALTAWTIGNNGVEVLFALSKLIIAIVIAMCLQYLIFGLMILVFARISPIPFYKKSVEYQILGFSTSSSKASLATTMKICREKLGISEMSTSFVLPLGASINMDGFAINLGLTTVFFSQMYGISLGLYDYLMIIITSTVGSIGGAGIPGASLIMLPMVLSSVGLPIEGVALLAGVDRILDMLRTTINITGDAAVTLIIDKSENKLNVEDYYK
jgi:Na+/H+-dicarboxylate symporter